MFPAEIEYFEDDQLSGILEAPGKEKRSERRNRMLLILGYDAAMRVGELIDLNVKIFTLMRKSLMFGYLEREKNTVAYP